VIIAQVIEPCLGQTNYVEIEGANVIKFKLHGPETSNIFIINAETFVEIRMRHSRTTHACIIETDHDQSDVELPALPAGFAAELLAAAGAPASGVLGVTTRTWSGRSLQ
jgi:hypothetical protein